MSCRNTSTECTSDNAIIKWLVKKMNLILSGCCNNSTGNQDNTTVVTTLDTVNNESLIPNIINNLPTFEVTETQNQYFYVRIFSLPRLYRLKLGKGVYGTGGTTITLNDLELIEKTIGLGNTDSSDFSNGLLIMDVDYNAIGALEGHLEFVDNGSGYILLKLSDNIINQLDSQNIRIVTYSNLPEMPNTGNKAFVTDSSVPASGNFGNIVSGGGVNFVPVYYDGTNWRIG